MWQIKDCQDQILALAVRGNGFKPLKLFPLRSGAVVYMTPPENFDGEKIFVASEFDKSRTLYISNI